MLCVFSVQYMYFVDFQIYHAFILYIQRYVDKPGHMYSQDMEKPLVLLKLKEIPYVSVIPKGTVARDFLPLVFFMNRPHMGAATCRDDALLIFKLVNFCFSPS
jgi:hypothetical protein